MSETNSEEIPRWSDCKRTHVRCRWVIDDRQLSRPNLQPTPRLTKTEKHGVWKLSHVGSNSSSASYWLRPAVGFLAVLSRGFLLHEMGTTHNSRFVVGVQLISKSLILRPDTGQTAIQTKTIRKPLLHTSRTRRHRGQGRDWCQLPGSKGPTRCGDRQ